jgi:hypothetical protein
VMESVKRIPKDSTNVEFVADKVWPQLVRVIVQQSPMEDPPSAVMDFVDMNPKCLTNAMYVEELHCLKQEFAIARLFPMESTRLIPLGFVAIPQKSGVTAYASVGSLWTVVRIALGIFHVQHLILPC